MCRSAHAARSQRMVANCGSLSHDAQLVECRQAWRDREFAEDYRRFRPMVERSIAWVVADAHRRVRFRGVEKNQFGLSVRIAAINLRRLINLGVSPGRLAAQGHLTTGAQARVVKNGTSPWACPSRVASSNPFSRWRFGRTYPGLRHRTYAQIDLCSTGS